MNLLYDIEDALCLSKLSSELESFILQCTKSSNISQLLAVACKNDADDIYKFIVENSGLKQYGNNPFDFSSFKHQHQANMDTLKYIPNGGSPKVRGYIENGLKEFSLLSSQSENAERYIDSLCNKSSSDRYVQYAIKIRKTDPSKFDDDLVYKILKYSQKNI
jgi:hypothetical protein